MSTNDYSNAIKEFAGSEVFFKIFDETIALVQKASDYLEGVGRFDQARLSGKEAALFASQSIKLTNCLMQVSSWLLGHRAYFKGEIAIPKEIDLEFYHIDQNEPMDKLIASLPTRLVVLVTQTSALLDRIIRMDSQLKNLSNNSENPSETLNHVHNQLLHIQQKFGILTTEKQEIISQ